MPIVHAMPFMQPTHAIQADNAFYAIYAMPIMHTMPFLQFKQCPLCMQCHLCSVHNAHCACNAICFVNQFQICKQCHSCRQYNANNAHNAICAHNTNFTGYSMPKVHAMPNVPHIWHRMLHNRNWIAAYLALTDSKLSWHIRKYVTGGAHSTPPPFKGFGSPGL